jgi:hypothetical protein
MEQSVMTNPERARAAGLLMPTLNDCNRCHVEKGSHVAVLKQPKMDMQEAWKAILHPTPETWKYMDPHAPLKAATGAVAKYTGSLACGECHRGPKMGYQYSKWRSGPHAQLTATRFEHLLCGAAPARRRFLSIHRGHPQAGNQGKQAETSTAVLNHRFKLRSNECIDTA